MNGTFRLTPNQNLIVSKIACAPGLRPRNCRERAVPARPHLQDRAHPRRVRPYRRSHHNPHDRMPQRLRAPLNRGDRPRRPRAREVQTSISAAARTASGSTRCTSRMSERRLSWQPSIRSSGIMPATVAKESFSAILPSVAGYVADGCGKGATSTTDMNRPAAIGADDDSKLSLVFELPALALAGGRISIAESRRLRSSHGRSRVRRRR
jgi:hypothetical protein